MSSPMKDFLDQFFELCKKYQEEIKPEIMAEILRAKSYSSHKVITNEETQSSCKSNTN